MWSAGKKIWLCETTFDDACLLTFSLRLWLFCQQNKNLDYFQENNKDKKSSDKGGNLTYAFTLTRW